MSGYTQLVVSFGRKWVSLVYFVWRGPRSLHMKDNLKHLFTSNLLFEVDLVAR